MNKQSKLIWGFVFFLVVFIETGVAGNEKKIVPPPYIPGLGEIMNNNVQPHHIKLSLSGQFNNWPLALYELDELREAFNAVKQYQGIWNDKKIAEMLPAFTDTHFTVIEKAIKEKDTKKFKNAYAQLTKACNACHQANDRSFIVIKIPDSSPFSNQKFEPIKTN